MKKSAIFLAILFVLINLVLALQSCTLMTTPASNTSGPPDVIKNQTALGLAYLEAGDIPRAKENLLSALHTAPHSTQTQSAMAYFFEKTGDIIQAEHYYQQAIHHTPPDGAALNNYGVFLCRQHRLQDAEKMFLAAAQQTAYLNTAQAYKNAGLCALSAGDTLKAQIYFKKTHLQLLKKDEKGFAS